MFGDYPGKCPKCGWFCADIKAIANEEGLKSVSGVCRKHGKIDLSNQGWSWEDFFPEGDFVAAAPRGGK